MHPLDLLGTLPTSISIEVSTKCPLNCVYCKRKGRGENIDKHLYYSLMRRIEESGCIKRGVFCGIGESFMNPEFYDLVKGSPFSDISIISSGALPIDFDRLEQTDKLKLVIFSIDAITEDGIKNCCGKNYRFDVLLENLRNLRELTKKNKKIMSLLNCTININNFSILPSIVEFASKHGFSIVHFSLPWGMEQFIVDNLEEIEKGIIEAKNIAQKSHIFCDNPFRSYCCIQYDSILPFVDIKGNLFPCGFALYKNFQVGNLFQSSFEELWTDARYEKFRLGVLCKECFMMRMDKLRKGEVKVNE